MIDGLCEVFCDFGELSALGGVTGRPECPALEAVKFAAVPSLRTAELLLCSAPSPYIRNDGSLFVAYQLFLLATYKQLVATRKRPISNYLQQGSN